MNTYLRLKSIMCKSQRDQKLKTKCPKDYQFLVSTANEK